LHSQSLFPPSSAHLDTSNHFHLKHYTTFTQTNQHELRQGPEEGGKSQSNDIALSRPTLIASSQGEKEFSIQPIKESSDAKFAPFNAHPGPARTNEMPKEEGSKAERQAKKESLNK
jgi:hypothetical protein